MAETSEHAAQVISPAKQLDRLIALFASVDGADNEDGILSGTLADYANAVLSYLSIPKREWIADPVGRLFSETNSHQQSRFIAAALLRLLGTNSKPFKITPFRHLTFKLFDRVYEHDLYKRLGVDVKAQTHEKETRLRDVCKAVEEVIERLDQSLPDLSSAGVVKAAISKALRNPDVRILAHPLMPNIDFDPVLNETFDAIKSYLQSDVGDALAAYSSAEGATLDLLERAEKVGTNYSIKLLFQPLLKVRNALHEHFTNSPLHASPSLSISASPKKYPFNQVATPLTLEMDVRNSGPGLALDVHLTIVDLTDADCQNKAISLGNLAISTLRIAIPITIRAKTPDLCVELDFEWTTFDKNHHKQRSTVIFQAQEAEIDWDLLQTAEPYDLEPVTSDAELVGRNETLNQLQSLLTSKQVGSAIVYGQKRVGKTSIVKTLSNRVSGVLTIDASVFYLEAGDYVRPEPIRTIEALTRKLIQVVTRSNQRFTSLSQPDLLLVLVTFFRTSLN